MKLNIPLIQTEDLNYTISSNEILKNISISINKGEYCAIIGPNGGGKSTLVKMFLNLLIPTSGHIRINGQDINDFKKFNIFGYVPQKVTQIDTKFPATVYEIVKLGRTKFRNGIFKFLSREDKEKIDESLKIMNIDHLKDRLIGDLSGGQRQRVMIAKALASEPEILILDEPNTGVDVESQKLFYSLLRDLNKNHNITIIFVTHDFGVISDDVDKVLCINQTLSCSHKSDFNKLGCDHMSELYGIPAHNHNHYNCKIEAN